MTFIDSLPSAPSGSEWQVRLRAKQRAEECDYDWFVVELVRVARIPSRTLFGRPVTKTLKIVQGSVSIRRYQLGHEPMIAAAESILAALDTVVPA